MGFLARIIPAYAGSTSSIASPTRSARDHPRIRGEHAQTALKTTIRAGSSPHTRGAPHRPRGRVGGKGIIPAYAGSTSAVRSASPLPRDHPRIRGEHNPHLDTAKGSGGSSPHTRGAPAGSQATLSFPRIIPAYAGSTSSIHTKGDVKRDHPRIRGEHRLFTEYERRGGGSSPHTRGARPIMSYNAPWTGIIPAYAGSTTPAPPTVSRSSDHPRIRGEHFLSHPFSVSSTGSSPHTRGAPSAWSAPSLRARIIPAYAGST